MSVDHIRYDLLTQDALRGVIRSVLADAAIKGLPGDHHFFITFDTRAEGVRISTRLKASYPEEMTIVLQHQFWDLAIGDSDFEVGLAFNGIPERLHVPLKAIKGFFDPSVQFGLQFTVDADSAEDVAEGEPADPVKSEQETKPPLPAEATLAGKKPKPRSDKAEPAAQANPTPDKDNAPAGEVVRLDRFRKK
jgi:uncharacterized protein